MSKGDAVWQSAALTFLFVGSVYLGQQQGSVDRNDPKVIKRRLLSVGIATTLCTLLTGHLWLSETRLSSVWGLGFPLFVHLTSSLKGLFLVSSLFVGSILLWTLVRLAFPHHYHQRETWRDSERVTWISLRNYLFIRAYRAYGKQGPAFEEIVFRGCISVLFMHNGYSLVVTIFMSPLFFGFAHLHHGFQTFRSNGGSKEALIDAVFQSLFQLVYTTLFGWFATWWFLHSGSLLSVTLCHALCNWFGFPDFGNLRCLSMRAQRAVYVTTLLGAIAFAAQIWFLASLEIPALPSNV